MEGFSAPTRESQTHMCRIVDPEHRGMGSLVWKVEVEVKLETRTQILWFIVRRGSSTVSKFGSVSCSVVSNSLWAHGLQHTRLPCPSPVLELTQIHVHWVSEAIQLSHPLSSPSPPTFSLSQQQDLFQWVSSSHQVAKVSASASVLPVNIQDWFPWRLTNLDLLAVQGTLKSLLQHHSSKASILWLLWGYCSRFIS